MKTRLSEQLKYQDVSQKMKLDIVLILSIILSNGSTAKANPIENQVVEDFLEELQLLTTANVRKSHKINKILMDYVESKYNALVLRIKGKILEIIRENLKLYC